MSIMTNPKVIYNIYAYLVLLTQATKTALVLALIRGGGLERLLAGNI